MSYSDKKVLVVEDNDMNRMLAGFALADFEITPEEASDGQEAVDMYMNAAEGYYDLIMMDILMPGMCGDEATKLIRAAGRSDSNTLPIVAMTAESDADEIAAFKDKGFTDYIEKPMEMENLEVILKNCLG